MVDELVIADIEENKKEIYGRRKAWCDAHGALMPEPIECLDLIMRKEFALRILQGKKNVELRDCTDHFIATNLEV